MRKGLQPYLSHIVENSKWNFTRKYITFASVYIKYVNKKVFNNGHPHHQNPANDHQSSKSLQFEARPEPPAFMPVPRGQNAQFAGLPRHQHLDMF